MLLLKLARQQKAQRQLTDKVKSAFWFSHHHFSDGNHGGCGDAFCSAGVCPLSYRPFNTHYQALTQGIMTLASFVANRGCTVVLFGFLLAIADELMRRPTWLVDYRQKLLLRIPIMGSLMREKI